MRLTLFGRSYCHLCEEMAQALLSLAPELGFTVVEVDVDSDPAVLVEPGAKPAAGSGHEDAALGVEHP